MDAFSLLRYWRSNGSGGGGDSTNNANLTTSTGSTTIVTAVSTQTSYTEEEDVENNDHGPFFDLEFSLPEEEEVKNEVENGVVFEEDEEESENEEAENGVVSVSPSDDLFFKGGVKTTSDETESQTRTVSLMKSATKLRVMMLKFNKKPILKNEENSFSNQHKKRQNDVESVTNEDKKFSKEAMHKYLRKVKPLYVRVSKRYGEKLKFSGHLKQTPSPSPSSTADAEKQSPVAKESNPEASEAALLVSTGKGLKQGNLAAGLGVVCKHLGKSRSASTAVVAAAPPGAISSKRRDDSLLQQQDGIQSAILHCKRSFKASRDLDCLSSLSSESVLGNGKSSSSDAVEMKKSDDDSQKVEK